MTIRLASVRSFLAAVLLSTGGLVAGARVAAAQDAKPFAAMSESALALRDSVVNLARAQVGQKYVFGGTAPGSGFDCSGLVRYVMAALDLETPRTASQQATLGAAVVKDPQRLRPGDLLTFSSPKGDISHIGIYVGDGRYVHASSKAGRVIESPIKRQSTTLITIWQGARRLMAFMDPDDGTSWKLIPSRRPTQPSLVARKIPPPSIFVTALVTRSKVTPAALFKTVPVSFAAKRAIPAPAQARRTV
jgi:hypothetical protein